MTNRPTPGPVLLLIAWLAPAALAALAGTATAQDTQVRTVAFCSGIPDIDADFIAGFAHDNPDLTGPVELVDPMDGDADLSGADALVMVATYPNATSLPDCMRIAARAIGIAPDRLAEGLLREQRRDKDHRKELPPRVPPDIYGQGLSFYQGDLPVVAVWTPTGGCIGRQRALLHMFEPGFSFHDRIPGCADEPLP